MHPWPAEAVATPAREALAVAVLDDETAAREAMAETLSAWGFHPVTGADAAEVGAALSAARLRPAAVVADYRLAGDLRGDEQIRRLREVFGDELPALLVTGESDPAVLAALRGADLPVLPKPVRPARLRAFLRGAERR